MENDILSSRERRRYAKQIMLPEIGIEGQEKLKNARVLVVGAGGLGCPVLQYLGAAGIGKLGIAEFDVVDESNLPRQVLYGSSDIGNLKSIIAKNRLEYLNPSTEVEVHNVRIGSSNSLRILEFYDVIVDATDNIETRYLLNDTCIILGKPMAHGSVYKYEGIVSVFNYKDGPTYRCYNPATKLKSPKNPLPSETGLFGVLPGVTGTLVAGEVIKIITGIGEVLSGKVLLINMLKNTFTTFSIKNIPENHNIKSISGI